MSTEFERIRNERDFHNERVLSDSENRVEQSKFYVAIGDCYENFHTNVRQLSAGKDVLEYGCFTGDETLRLAPVAKTITGIDISDVAIEKAKANCVFENVHFHTMNAEALDFHDQSFDLVFGSSILHHLDLQKAYSEIARVLRPGGIALFIEPFGHNLLINTYRKRTPSSRTVDEHPLLWKDLEFSKQFFSSYSVETYGLTTLLATPLRHCTKLLKPLLTFLRSVDKLLFKIPFMQKQAWVGFITFYK